MTRKRTGTKKPAKRAAKKITKKKVAKSKLSEEERMLRAAEGEVASSDEASTSVEDSDTAPLTEEQLQEMLDGAVMGTYIDGQPSVAGHTLMDITALAMTLLKKTNNGLVSGLALSDVDNTVLESAKFMALWQEPEDGDWDKAEDEAIRLAKPANADELESRGLKWLGKLRPNQLGDVTNEAIFALKDAMSTQVEPIPHKEDDADDDIESGEEMEGND
jgi:hypothetical protein